VNSQYFAVCGDSSHGTTGWSGPFRSSYDDAQKDADTHNAGTGHDAQVAGGDKAESLEDK
jgi:hypothetical protein